MSGKNIARAWKDEDYFAGLSKAEQGAIPDNPAGNARVSLSGQKGLRITIRCTLPECTNIFETCFPLSC